MLVTTPTFLKISSLVTLTTAAVAGISIGILKPAEAGGVDPPGPDVSQFTVEMVPASDHGFEPLCPLMETVVAFPDCWGDVNENGLELPAQILETWSFVDIDPDDCMIMYPSANPDGTGTVEDPPFLNLQPNVRLVPHEDGSLRVMIRILHYEGRKARKFFSQQPRLQNPFDHIEDTFDQDGNWTGFILHVHQDAIPMVNKGKGNQEDTHAGYISAGDIVFTLVP